MQARVARALLLLGALPLLQCARANEGEPSPALVAHATEVLEHLRDGQYESILAQMHYPPDYTSEQLAEDRAALEAGLTFLMSEFGALESFSLQRQPIDFYKLGISAGPPDYWPRQPNLGITAALTFRTKHAQLDPGVVQVTYCEVGGERFIRSLEFGIPMAGAGSKERANALASGLLESMRAAGGAAKSLERAI